NPRRTETSYIPMSALNGDNVVERSQLMPWYDGPPLLELLEQVEVAYDHPDEKPARFPVQWVIRPTATVAARANGNPSSVVPAPAGAEVDYRGYSGQLASGALRVGDEV